MSEIVEKPPFDNEVVSSHTGRSKKKENFQVKPSVRPTREIKSKGVNKELIRKKQLEIVAASTKLFAEKGYHGTSMREISQESSIHLAYLYNYFSAKEDILYLFYHHLNEHFAPLYEELAASDKEDPLHQFIQFVKDLLKLIMKYKIELRTAYTEIRHLEGESLNAILEVEHECVKCIEKVIIRGEKLGVFKVPDAHFTANAISLLLMLNALRGWNLDKQHYTFNRHVKLMTNSILRLLGVDPCQSQPEMKVQQG